MIEYTKSKGLKTRMVVTQIINHATPAGFSVHNTSRNNYDEIAKAQITSGIDLMFGGGRSYFSKYTSEMTANNYKWINSLSDIDAIAKDQKVIGTFAEGIISEETEKTSLADMTEAALSRLENDNGFFLMIEGSDILTNSLFTSNGQHTEANVLVYAYGAGASELTQYDLIDNTSIYKFVKQALVNEYGE